MKLRIESDGTPGGTRVLDEDGNQIERVVDVKWSCAIGQRGLAQITLALTPVRLTGEIDSQVLVREGAG